MDSQANYNQMSGTQESAGKRYGKQGGKFCGLCCLAVFVLAALLQAFMYWWGAMQCSAKNLVDYEYPGGGPKELVTGNSLLIEQDPRWWGTSFTVQPADDAGLALGASTGVYYRTWGPFFWTYVYQDDLGKQTFMARDRPLALGGSHKIMRCDGTGPTYVVSEGTHVVMNSIREMFGMYTSRIYNIYEGSKLVALSEKIGGAGQSHKQLIFRDPHKASPFASAFLSERHYHGNFDKWFVHDEKNTELPAWVINAGTALMAFPTAAAKRKAAAKQAVSTPPPKFLAELPPAVGAYAAAAPAEAHAEADMETEVALAATPAKDVVDPVSESPAAEDTHAEVEGAATVEHHV